MAEPLDIPPAWQALDFSRLRGTIMVVGRPDRGKSTFSRFLFQRLAGLFSRVAYLDGDPGQSTLGPPCTMTLGLSRKGDAAFPPRGPLRRYFTGSTSPRAHMLQFLVGAGRLNAAAWSLGAEAVVYDTSGFIDASGPGAALKWAKIELLRPSVLVALQREKELEPLLAPLRRSRWLRVWALPCSAAAIQRNPQTRRAHRAAKYAGYFAGSSLQEIEWTRYAVFPAPGFQPQGLLALETRQGYAAGLGIVTENDLPSQKIQVLTPLASLRGIEALKLGDMALDPENFADRFLRPPSF